MNYVFVCLFILFPYLFLPIIYYFHTCIYPPFRGILPVRALSPALLGFYLIYYYLFL